MRLLLRSGLPSKLTPSCSRSIHASGSPATRPLTRTRPSLIQRRASLRDPTPALERTRSRVFSGRLPGGGDFFICADRRRTDMNRRERGTHENTIGLPRLYSCRRDGICSAEPAGSAVIRRYLQLLRNGL